MRYLLIIPAIFVLYYVASWTLGHIEEGNELSLASIISDKKSDSPTSKENSLSPEKVVDTDFTKKKQIVVEHLDSEDPNQKELLDLLTTNWDKKAQIDSALIATKFKAEASENSESLFQSFKMAMVKLPTDRFALEKSAIFDFMSDLEFEGSGEEVRRLALLQLKDQALTHETVDESSRKLLSSAYTSYLARSDNPEEVLAQTQELVKIHQDPVVKQDILEQLKQKFPQQSGQMDQD